MNSPLNLKGPCLDDPCLGPCLSHCDRTATQLLAAAAVVYASASVLYLLFVALCGVGTPFKDSLSVEQREILASSKRVRGRIFLTSVAVSALVVYAARKQLF